MTEAEKLFKEIAGDNEEAFTFCCLWSSYCHLFDDLLDGDVAPTALRFVEVENLLARVLHCNFFRKNYLLLAVQRILIAESFAASEVMRLKQGREVQWGLLLSHSGNDMLRLVALIIGGEQHLNTVSEKLRALTLKEHYGTTT